MNPNTRGIHRQAKWSKKIISLLMAAILLLGVLPIAALAAGDGNWYMDFSAPGVQPEDQQFLNGTYVNNEFDQYILSNDESQHLTLDASRMQADQVNTFSVTIGNKNGDYDVNSAPNSTNYDDFSVGAFVMTLPTGETVQPTQVRLYTPVDSATPAADDHNEVLQDYDSTVSYAMGDGWPGGSNTTLLYRIDVIFDLSVPVPEDTTAPVITAPASTTIAVGDTFDAMAGVSATDDTDGDLTSAIQVSGSVDTTTVGTYTLTYTVSDTAGNSTTVTKTVAVTAVAGDGHAYVDFASTGLQTQDSTWHFKDASYINGEFYQYLSNDAAQQKMTLDASMLTPGQANSISITIGDSNGDYHSDLAPNATNYDDFSVGDFVLTLPNGQTYVPTQVVLYTPVDSATPADTQHNENTAVYTTDLYAMGDGYPGGSNTSLPYMIDFVFDLTATTWDGTFDPDDVPPPPPVQDAIKDVSLEIGSDQTQRNFAWYATSATAGTVQLALKSDMTGSAFPTECQEFTAVLGTTSQSSYVSDKATATGLTANTEYVYRVGNDDGWSDVYGFKTQSFSGDFSFLAAGDPQIGVRGVETDVAGWTNTLTKAATAFTQTSFLVTLGDQVQGAGSEAQYDGLLAPEILKSMTLATTVGNHDLANNYTQHFNMPNVSGTATDTAAGIGGGDYWYVYNNTLFLSLNINNTSAAAHKAFMESAIAANPDVKWKIVTEHFSLFHITNSGYWNITDPLREELAPIFSELGIDVVLNGHDHSYQRTFLMNGTTPDSATGGASVTNPTAGGVLYINTNSSSGSLYCGINNNAYAFIAARNQENVPNISKVDITDSSFTITTYRVTDMTIVDTFTINKTTSTEDTTAPVFTVPADTTLALGDQFDPMAGVSAIDNLDGDLTSNIEMSGSVDTATAGTYTLTYTVSDAAGNTATATRTVIVAAQAIAIDDFTMQYGSDESSMNFTWYSGSAATTAQVQIALKSAMSGPAFPVSAATTFDGTAAVSGSHMSCKVCVTDFLTPDTQYVYRVGDGTGFSEVYSFSTRDLTDGYNVTLVGDPQIGSGGYLNGDDGWKETVSQMLTNFPDTSFILSAGDQVNTASDEEQYAAFFAPTELTTLPVVPAIGNHDNSGTLYTYHYNSPNESTTYGTTSAGGDYWFTYGNTLYMVLNSNNMSTTSHDAFMQEAIDTAGSGIVWKIVMFHHAPYSSASHSTDGDIVTRRNELYPVFDKYDIDVVLNGHDHVYTRTFQMEGGIAQNGLESAVINPVGTLYITANSGSGSKYYDLQNADTSYMAARWQGKVPSYSNIEITDDSFTITTYRTDKPITDPNSVIDTYTINKTLSSAPTGLVGVEPTTIDNNDAKITGTTAAMEYKLTTQTEWTPCADDETTNLAPGVYDVRFSGTVPSVSTIVTILPFGGVNQDQAAPEGLIGVEPTTSSNDDGMITGTSTDMEYRTSGASSWTTCTGTSITDLTPGNYEVRIMAKPGFNASAPVYLSISRFSSGGSTTIISRISTGSDDVEESASDGSMDLNSSDLEFMNDGDTNQYIGLRFTSLDIPAGATITGAYIQFSVDEEDKNTDTFGVAIAGEQTANSSTFTSSAANLSGRTQTDAVAYWSDIPKWTVEHEAGTAQRTPDLSAIVQEVVDLDDWAAGNAISFGFFGEGVRSAESYEGANGDLSQIPTLYVTYEYIPSSGELTVPIGSALDDMEERPDGSLDWDSSDLEITREKSDNNQQIGLRFADLQLPEGAVITDAYIQFSVDETKTIDPFDVKIYTDSTINSAPFENKNFTVSERTKSDAFVTWKDIAPWENVHEAGELQQTPDLSALVQDILDNGEWTPGNAISFILVGDGQRCAESFEGAGSNTEQIPTLHITYTTNKQVVIDARNALMAEMENGKYTYASIGAAQLVVDAVNAALAGEISKADRIALLEDIQCAMDALVLINQAKLTVEPNTVASGDNWSVVYSVSIEQLQNVDVMEGFVKLSDDRFEIAQIKSLYMDSNVIFTKNTDFNNDSTTGYFSLVKIGGFDDMAKMDVVNITIRLKDGETLNPDEENVLEAALDSITMFVGNANNYTATEVYSAIVGNGTALTHIWFPSEVKGDISGDGSLTGMDLAIAVQFFGKTESGMGDEWYSTGGWLVDINKDGVIDISDLTIVARLIANQNNH